MFGLTAWDACLLVGAVIYFGILFKIAKPGSLRITSGGGGLRGSLRITRKSDKQS